MENIDMTMWLGPGIAVLIGLVAMIGLRQKSREISRKDAIIEERDGAIIQHESELSQKEAIILQKNKLIADKDREINLLTEKLEAACAERDEKSAELNTCRLEYEERIDESAQFVREQLAEAEQARQEAEQARDEAAREARDSYQAVAEVNALLHEKAVLLNTLHQRVVG
ncbi:MAG: hypothetical protein ACK5PS_01310 [Desulfopila sp.]